MKPKNFRSISLQKNLVDYVEVFVIANGQYKSIAEFISEATRLRMEQIVPPEIIKQYQKLRDEMQKEASEQKHA